ncbi:hypothetical protein D5R81_12045 [Parashewanella spongiae]|uniref:Uncharacterized protein n=1 Tax=Parashewanella spongiae TaxID=342950 RepID=A0A3A6TLG2_9GAMM|nr:hypothetical protein [Parashewanella spongiae]MCL1078634.1 hypothetical protein [Parashewanella spongiae]RJY12973.1 hypothetical protein D5R81_12045 [Parashewanella spongiae]
MISAVPIQKLTTTPNRAQKIANGVQAVERFSVLTEEDCLAVRIEGYQELFENKASFDAMTYDMRAHLAWNLAEDYLCLAEQLLNEPDPQLKDKVELLTLAFAEVEKALANFLFAKNNYRHKADRAACDAKRVQIEQKKNSLLLEIATIKSKQKPSSPIPCCQRKIVIPALMSHAQVKETIRLERLPYQNKALGVSSELELESTLLEPDLEDMKERLSMLPKTSLLAKYGNAHDIATAYWNVGVQIIASAERRVKQAKEPSIKSLTPEKHIKNQLSEYIDGKEMFEIALSCLEKAREIYSDRATKESCDEEILSCKKELAILIKKMDKVNKPQPNTQKDYCPTHAIRPEALPVCEPRLHDKEKRNTKSRSSKRAEQSIYKGTKITTRALDFEQQKKISMTFDEFINSKPMSKSSQCGLHRFKPKLSQQAKQHFKSLQQKAFRQHFMLSRALSTDEIRRLYVSD